jgi:hypothetical protein
VDALKNCKVWISACSSSIFIRECENCTFYTCCRQLRLRDVKNCVFYIFSQAEVHIEFSTGVYCVLCTVYCVVLCTVCCCVLSTVCCVL